MFIKNDQGHIFLVTETTKKNSFIAKQIGTDLILEIQKDNFNSYKKLSEENTIKVKDIIRDNEGCDFSLSIKDNLFEVNQTSDYLAKKILKRFNKPLNKDVVISSNTSKEDKDNKTEDISYKVVTPDISFDDIVLSQKSKEQIDNSLDLISLNEIFSKINPKIFKEVNSLAYNLFGESGTGKTQTAKAIANYYNKKILWVNYSQLISKYHGETGKNIERYFKYAQDKDLILFFDEADTIIRNRESSNNNSQDQNIFMQNVDDFKGIIILTTNKFQDYDKAMIRRFVNVEYNLPTIEMISQILRKNLPDLDIDFDLISRKAEGLSGGDLISAITQSYGSLARSLKKNNVNYLEDLPNHNIDTNLIITEIEKVQSLKENKRKPITL